MNMFHLQVHLHVRLYWASALYQLHSYFICETFLFQLDSSHLEHFNLQLI